MLDYRPRDGQALVRLARPGRRGGDCGLDIGALEAAQTEAAHHLPAMLEPCLRTRSVIVERTEIGP